jgi:hypothetical protein
MFKWLKRLRDPRRCSVTEEWQGLFIGRRHCHRHNVVWDDGGNCPRVGEEPGQPFMFARYMGEGRR